MGIQFQSDAIDDLVELREKLSGPAEAAVFLGWLRVRAGKAKEGRADLEAYLSDHPDGPLAKWARELLATPAARHQGARRE